MKNSHSFLEATQTLIQKHKTALLLAVSLILGAYLRLHHLAERSFWLDEADGANLLNYHFSELWERITQTANNPGYIFSLKLWSLFAGNSEFSLRMLSAIAGIFSILAIFYLGKAFYNKKIGWLAAFILAVNYFSIFFSIQARQYSLSILFSILSLYFFWKLISFPRSGIRPLFFYIILTAFGTYLHPWFFLILFTQTGYLFLGRSSVNRFRIWLSQGLILVLSLPWLVELLKNGKSGASAWIGTAQAGFFYETFNYFVWGNKIIFLVAFLLAIFYILTDYADKNNPKEKFFRISKNTLFLILSLFIPLVAAFVISIFIPFYKTGRYEAVLLPVFILLAARFLAEIKNKLIVSAICAGLFFSTNASVIKDQKEIQNYSVDDRVAALYLLNHSHNNDIFIFTGLSRPPFEYYLPRFNKDQKKVFLFSFPKEMSSHPAYQNQEKDNSIDLEGEADQMIQKIKEQSPENVFLVYSPQTTGAEFLTQKLGENFKKIKEAPVDSLNPEIKSGLVSPLHFNQIIIYQGR